MHTLKRPSFIVDLSSSMVINSDTKDSYGSNQKLFCKCGHKQKFDSKVVRNIIKNYDELTEDSESLKSIKCEKCGCVYNKMEKLYLLEPNVEEIYKSHYNLRYTPSIENENNVFFIEKTKSVARYCDKKNDLLFRDVVDKLTIDVNSGVCELEMNTPFEKNESLYNTYKKESGKTVASVLEKLNITNVKFLEEFFSYTDSVKYSGLENLSDSLEELKYYVKDLDKFDSVYFIDFIKSKHKINFENDALGNTVYHQYVDSGFGDGKLIKKDLTNLGDYLFNTMHSYKLLVSMISFESASCIIHTKGYNFFKNWIESNFILPPAIYKKHKATNPNSIMEVSIQYDTDGKERVSSTLSNVEIKDTKKLLKVSSTINNSIKIISNLGTLSDCKNLDYISKENLEFLLQNHESSRVYGLISKVNKSNTSLDSINLSFKNIKHILDCNLDLDGADYITIYKDTVRVIDLLDVKSKVIFKCKTYMQLRDLHDDYTSRYNAMKDAKKAEFYQKSIAPFKKMNTQIGDVKFEIVESAERLNLEGLQMHHCIYTYLNRICDKEYIAINVTHVITKERATAGFIRRGETLSLEQLKGYYNSRATEELIDSTLDFCKQNNISLRSIHSLDMRPDVSRERAMPGQMSKENLFKLRKDKSEDKQESLNVETETKKEKKIVMGFIKKIFK